METTLWLIVVVTLTLAIGMAVIAWRLLRGDRQRQHARVTALRHMALDPPPEPVDASADAPVDPPIRFVSETRQTPARPAAPAWDQPEPRPTPPPSADYLRWEEPVASAAPPPFSTLDRPASPTRRWLPAMAVLCFLVLGAGTVYGIYGPVGGSLPSLGRFSIRGHAEPLALLSLSHRSEGGDFVVTGLVQNPVGGQSADHVTAVVFAFNSKGEYFASGTGALEFSPLAPGAESPFVVRIPKVSGVKRFRVGFRTQSGTVVAHVDRRDQPLESITTGGN